MNIKVTQQQRDNALEALNVMWPSVPPENVSPRLWTWREGRYDFPVDCKTIACFGGWCAIWPGFAAQGVTFALNGSPRAGDLYPGLLVGEFMFGDVAIFYQRGDHDADFCFKGTDHELVSHRLKCLIENSKVVA